MNQVTSILLFIGVMVIIFLLKKGSTKPQLVDDDGVEVFRGDEPSVQVALGALSDQGISAWIETNSERSEAEQHSIHVDANQVETVRVLMAGAVVGDT